MANNPLPFDVWYQQFEDTLLVRYYQLPAANRPYWDDYLDFEYRKFRDLICEVSCLSKREAYND